MLGSALISPAQSANGMSDTSVHAPGKPALFPLLLAKEERCPKPRALAKGWYLLEFQKWWGVVDGLYILVFRPGTELEEFPSEKERLIQG